MGRSSERAVAGVTSGQIGYGDTVTWDARHFGVRFRLTSEVTEFTHPTRFVDEQISGPFKRWWHEHEFIADGNVTRMIDRVEFAAPFGVLGRIAEKLVLDRYLERLIRRRSQWLKCELEGRS